MNKQELYTELSIQIAILEAKVDRILELILNEIEPKQPHWTDEEFREEFK